MGIDNVKREVRLSFFVSNSAKIVRVVVLVV